MRLKLLTISQAILLSLFITPVVYANNDLGIGSLFNVSSSGTPANLNITLCLNSSGPISCQNYSVTGLTLSISTNIPNHSYPNAGIKINTAGYTPSGCSLISNGYCVFSASQNTPDSIAIAENNPTSFSYPMVAITAPGNSADITGFGAVNYQYEIGKYDVTTSQYTDFLNSVAQTDTYGLYNSNMGTDLNIAGISRSGSSGSYSYTVMSNSGDSSNRPITYVSWINAARFANWMANGRPTGAEDSTTSENGAYDLSTIDENLENLNPEAPSKNNVNPNTNNAPTYYIPTENQWYKAAYYDPELDSDMGGYYLYPTQSNTAPGNSIGSSANQSNYFTTVFSLTQESIYISMEQNYLTDVGAFSNSASYYGTFDQGGLVWQWNDLDGTELPYRGLRGGYWWSGSIPLQSVLYSTDSITRASNDIGFRLAGPV